jgi:hypothetical protein
VFANRVYARFNEPRHTLKQVFFIFWHKAELSLELGPILTQLLRL